MATVTETTATAAQLIDDLAALLENETTAWADADPGMTNTGASNWWYDNGRVFANQNTGTILAFYLAPSRAQQDYLEEDRNSSRNSLSGIRILHASDWNAIDHVPSGYNTAAHNGDRTINNFIGRDRRDSYVRHNYWNGRDDDTAYHGTGLWIWHDDDQTSSREQLGNREVTYSISAADDYLTIAAWSNANSTTGSASYLAWDHVTDKFTDDGVVPVAIVNRNSGSRYSTRSLTYTHYGFTDFEYEYLEPGFVGGDNHSIREGEWGRLNPDANDDTFFVRRSVIHHNHRHNTPVAYFDAALPNHPDEGIAHGDTVSYGGREYRAFVQSGASQSTALSACLRFE